MFVRSFLALFCSASACNCNAALYAFRIFYSPFAYMSTCLRLFCHTSSIFFGCSVVPSYFRCPPATLDIFGLRLFRTGRSSCVVCQESTVFRLLSLSSSALGYTILPPLSVVTTSLLDEFQPLPLAQHQLNAIWVYISSVICSSDLFASSASSEHRALPLSGHWSFSWRFRLLPPPAQ